MVEYVFLLQGAPERIISFCTKILVQDREYDIDDEWRDAFNTVVS